MGEPNDLLTAARERCPSRRLPGAGMSRQELADAANAWLAEHAGRGGGMDARYVGKLERGAVRWPNGDYRAALRAILAARGDAELGFSRAPQGHPDTVDRKQFLKVTAGVGAGAIAARLPTGGPGDLAEAVAGPTGHYRRMESAVSTRELSPAVEAHLRLAAGIVDDRLPTAAGYGVLAETTGLAAWLAADRGDTATARGHYADAVAHAERAHHGLLTAYMRASLGQFAVDSGDPAHGLTLLARARGELDSGAPDAARAWLAALHAVAHAALGDRPAAHTELRTAESLAGSGRGEPRWPWVFAFDAAKAARYHATAHAALGDLDPARDAYHAAGPALANPKPRAAAQVEHAHVLAHTGHLGEACALAADALRTGRQYRSERITHRVRRFRATLPTGATGDTAALDDELAALYTASAP